MTVGKMQFVVIVKMMVMMTITTMTTMMTVFIDRDVANDDDDDN